MKEKQITPGDAGRRLDRYLGRTFPSLPRSLMYKEIRKKNIKVNKKRCTPEQVLAAGDRVTLYLPDDVLAEKTVAATARRNELSEKIKAAEKRMAEIAVLRTHIVNYAKTRDTYVAYRKAGYSKKFRQEHEEEILLHQAAKEAFNELNVKKLPTIKELQTEYAQLLADKKKAYGEYRQARAAMRELLTVKNNVDRVLAMEQTEPQQKEKDHGQR